MSREYFSRLCDRIIAVVGEKEFKLESHINAFLKDKNSMYIANQLTTSGYISGKVKHGICIRILAGGSYYVLGVIFDIGTNHCTNYFDVFKRNGLVILGLVI